MVGLVVVVGVFVVVGCLVVVFVVVLEGLAVVAAVLAGVVVVVVEGAVVVVATVVSVGCGVVEAEDVAVVDDVVCWLEGFVDVVVIEPEGAEVTEPVVVSVTVVVKVSQAAIKIAAARTNSSNNDQSGNLFEWLLEAAPPRRRLPPLPFACLSFIYITFL